MSKHITTDVELFKMYTDWRQTLIDSRRGIPESMITEIRTTEKHFNQILMASLKIDQTEFNKINETLDHVARKARSIEPLELPIMPLPSDIAHAMAKESTSGQPKGIRGFDLPFIQGFSTITFNTERDVHEVRHGIIGWTAQYDAPTIRNQGFADGETITGDLTLGWKATVPNDGVFALNPRQLANQFVVSGEHVIGGDDSIPSTVNSWFSSSLDSEVEVRADISIHIGDRCLYSEDYLVSRDATKCIECRRNHFIKWIDFPREIRFHAEEGQPLVMLINLHGMTWANDDGYAEIKISMFGVPSNGEEYLTLDVMD